MTQVLIIAGVVIIVAIGSWLLFGPARTIGVSTTTISVAAGTSAPFTATLLAKGWGFGKPAATGGTLTPRTGSSVFTVTPATRTTTAGSPNAVFDVNGAAPGTGTIIMNGTSAGAHDVAKINVTVTGH